VGTDFRVGAWLVRPSLNTVSRNGASIHLQPKAMEVLVSLARQPGETISKDQLLKTIWPGTFVTDDVLIGSISELRRVLEDDAREPRFIQTIPKRGYRLIAPVGPANGVLDKPTVLTSSQTGGTSTTEASHWQVGAAAFAGATLLLVVLIASSGKIQRWLSAASSSSSIHSIAVLPLQNLSGDATQEYFSDGMTDALITDLAQMGSVKVISRTSSMQYKQTKKSLPEIARELNVDGIVEGTVQRSGDRVRITAQLIHGSTDKHLWANSYERDIRDVFALERDVASEITRQVQANLSPSRTSLSGPRAVDSKVVEAYLQGNYHLNLQGRGSGDEEKKKAAEYFQQAIDADPSFALAYVGLAAAHQALLWPTSQDVEVNRRASDKVIELDPNSPWVHVYRGERKEASWDWRGAEEEYHRAIALNPSSFDAHASLATLLLTEGRLDDSIREAEIAQSLDSTWNVLSDILYAAREYDRAIELDKALLLKDPDNGYFHAALYSYYAAQGMHKESVEEGEKALTLVGLSEEAAHVHQAFAVSGFRGAMREIANVFEQLAARKKVFSPVNAAAAYARFGDKDRAFYWLEQAYVHRDVQLLAADDNLSQINVNPTFDGLHSDPRFKDLLRRMSLPP
jgi:TolB-like protein/DNA-binding winged helix-turn-helix (wHTH) protein